MEEKFTFFWHGPFSQWHMCNFVSGGDEFNCAEQFMMARKAQYFGDLHIYEKIMKANHPRDQKHLGRQVAAFDRERWEAIARDIVYLGNIEKFGQNPDLLKVLKETEGTTLVEASPHDKIWGIGLAEDDPRAQDRNQWQGKNWLGEVLVAVREMFLGTYQPDFSIARAIFKFGAGLPPNTADKAVKVCESL